jgi:hypothetical protein
LAESVIFLNQTVLIVCGRVHFTCAGDDLPPLSKVSEGAHFRKLEASSENLPACHHHAQLRRMPLDPLVSVAAPTEARLGGQLGKWAEPRSRFFSSSRQLLPFESHPNCERVDWPIHINACCLFVFHAKAKARLLRALHDVRDQVRLVADLFPQMPQPEASLEFRPQLQGPFDFGLRGCPDCRVVPE